MGLFDKLFKKHKGDDKYILFAKAGLLLSHADGDFSDQENQWIVEYVESIPNITEDRVDNILKKGSENLAEISSFSELKSLNDKKEFINFLIGVAKADGVLDALELKFITILIEHLSLQDEYEDFLNSIDKKNIEENYDYSNALQVFYKKMENPAIKPWYEIIEKRAGTETIPDFKNDYVLDYTIHLEADMFFHLEKYISRIKLDISDKWRLGVSDLEQRIDVFTEITDALSLLITKAKDLKIDINKEFINNYHAAISSRMGSELGLKVINQKIKVSSEAETVFNRINKKYLAISKTEKIDFITFITDYLKTYFLEYYTKKVDEFVEDKEKNEQGVNTDNLTKNVIRDEDGFKNIYLRHKESSDSDRILLYELLRTEIERTLETLTPREADVVRLFFGLGNQHPMTLEEIGETLELTTNRTRQIKEKAIRRIKHTTKSKVLKTYLEYRDQIWNKEVRSRDIVHTIKPIKINNETLRAAVKEWLEDDKKAEVKYGHISNWDTSAVTNMSYMFRKSNFNQDISNWDVSNVTSMQEMFFHAKAFNQPIGNWDVGKVTDMSFMFYAATAFNRSVANWDVSNVLKMESMFSGANIFYRAIFMEARGPFQVYSTKLNKKKWELLKKYEKLNHQNEEVSLEIENQKYASGWNLNELRVFTQINKTFFLILSDQKIENSKNLKNESKDNRFMHIYSFVEIAIKKEGNGVWKEIAKDFPSFFSIYIEEEELYPDSKETLSILENLSKRKKIELLYTLCIVMGLTITLINDSGKNADEIKLKTEKAESIFNSYYEILKVKFTGEDYKEMQQKYAAQVVDWLNKNSSLNQYFEQPINVFIKANNI